MSDSPTDPERQESSSDSRQNDLIELVLIVCGLTLLPLLLSLINAWQSNPAPAIPAGSPLGILASLWNLCVLWFLMRRGLPNLMNFRPVWRCPASVLSRGILGAAALGLTSGLLGLILPPPATGMPFKPPQTFLEILVPLATLLVAVSFEELLYRVYYLERLQTLSIKPRPALVVTVLLFMIGHQYQGIHGLVVSGVLGTMLGLAWLRWRRYWLNWIAHFGYNAFVLAAAWWLKG